LTKPGNARRMVAAAADVALSTGPTEVYWITISAGATGGTVELMDGATDTGDALFVTETIVTRDLHATFDPPIQFKTGLFLDIGGSNVTVMVGFA
jgi:hypothetical protein